MSTNGKESSIVEEIFDKTSKHITRLINKMWLSRYPRCRYIIYDNGSEFKLNFEYCETYSIKRCPRANGPIYAGGPCTLEEEKNGYMCFDK